MTLGTAATGQAGYRTPRDTPRVSLGMPLFNAERYLAKAFDSLLAQDYRDFEIIVCDNASTDRTWEICEKYALIDRRIRLFGNDKNHGAAYNYNRTVELARGQLFKWVAHDDICAPTLLGRCVAALDEAGSQAVLAYPQTMLIDDDGAEIGPYRDGLDLRSPRRYRRVARFARNWSLCNAVFGVVRTDVLRTTGMIRPYLSSDVALLAELAALGQFHEVPQQLFRRRIHAESSRQGEKSLHEAAQWFDPERASTKPPKVRLARRVTSALFAADISRPDRIRCVAAFLAVWGARKAHIKASRWKRTFRSRSPSPEASRRHARQAGGQASEEAP